MTYQEQLRDIRWLVRRNEILERDDYCCQDCLRSPKNGCSTHIKLQVHHRQYFDGLMAWEYSDQYLVTLCDRCHSMFHGIIEDSRTERQKPVYIYGMRDFDSRPVRHIRDVMIDMINHMINGK